MNIPMVPQLLEKILELYGQEGIKIIQESIKTAKKKHKNHRRDDNSEYLLHVLSVAEILLDWSAPVEVIAAGILHDVLKPKYVNSPDDESWKENFSEKIINTVKCVNDIDVFSEQIQKNREISAQDLAIAKTKLLSELIDQNPEAVIIKLADRLHNLRTIQKFSAARKKAFLRNVQNLSVSIASRLGMGKISRELQDRSFQLLEPEFYERANVIYENAVKNPQLDELIEECRKALGDVVKDTNLSQFITNRYGIYRGTLERNGTSPSVWDISYVNITVKDLKDCYTALGVIHSYKNFESAGYLKDFIASPKLNGYRALHTKLWKKKVGNFQIAIMTEEMAKIAEFGYTAKWKGIDEDNIPRYREPISSEGKISVLTPYGKIVSLKPKSTPVDFAFNIHQEVGYSYMYALVNGEWKSADTLLEDGDVVDIITSKTPLEPDEKWAKGKSGRVRTAIRNKLKEIPHKYYEFMVEGFDRVGLLQEVIRLFTNRYFNIISIQAIQKPGNKFDIRCEIENRHWGKPEKVEELIKDLQDEIYNVRSIISVEPKSIEKPVNKIRENPYSILPKAAENFKGRENEVYEIARYFREDFERHGLFYISGQYKIGKTYLLRYLRDSILPDKKTVNVSITLENLSIGPKENVAGEVLYEIASEIFSKLQKHSAFLKEPLLSQFKQSSNPIEQFNKFLNKVEDIPMPLRVVIMLDECQKIDAMNAAQQSGFEELFRYFRAIVRDPFKRLNFTIIICGAGHSNASAEKLSTKVMKGLTKHIHLDCLDYEAAKSLVVMPISNAQINARYEDNAVERILFLTNCHPFYIQYLCRDLYGEVQFRNLLKNEFPEHLITLEDVEKFVEDQFRSTDLLHHLEHFWEMGEEQEEEKIKASKLILTAIAHLKKRKRRTDKKNIEKLLQSIIPVENLERELQDLADYGTVILIGDKYHFKIPLLEMWLCKTQRLPNEKDKANYQ
ncbi:MAG: HD domain-containing protein [Pyrinomonadaceae bacterium]